MPGWFDQNAPNAGTLAEGAMQPNVGARGAGFGTPSAPNVPGGIQTGQGGQFGAGSGAPGGYLGPQTMDPGPNWMPFGDPRYQGPARNTGVTGGRVGITDPGQGPTGRLNPALFGPQDPYGTTTQDLPTTNARNRYRESLGLPPAPPSDWQWNDQNPVYQRAVQQQQQQWSQQNPGVPYPGTPGNTGNQPGAPGGNTPGAPTGNPTDRAYIIQQLTNVLQQHGIQPGPRGSGPGDVEYYADQVLATGGWQGGNAGYWTNRLGSDIAGGGGRGGSGGGGGGYTLSNPNDLTGGFTDQFNGLNGKDLENTPGYQFALQQGLQGIDRGAAAKGTLLTMGNQKDRAGFASGLAQQTYGDEWNRAHTSYMDAFNIFNTNQNNLFNRNLSLANLGLGAAGGQAGAAQNIGNNQATAYTNQGNVQGAGRIQQGNNWADTANTLGQLGTIGARAWLGA